MFRRSTSKKVSYRVAPYPAGDSLPPELFEAQLRGYGVRVVQVDPAPPDYRIVRVNEIPRGWLSAAWAAYKDQGALQDSGNKDAWDCEDAARFLQVWAAQGLTMFGHTSRGGHGIMNLGVTYGARPWGQSVEARIGSGRHALNVVCTANGPVAVDIAVGDSIPLAQLLDHGTDLVAWW